jgi:hypothetical protein
MADRSPSGFSDMLLRVQIRSTDWEVYDLLVGMRLQKAAD